MKQPDAGCGILIRNLEHNMVAPPRSGRSDGSAELRFCPRYCSLISLIILMILLIIYIYIYIYIVQVGDGAGTV